MPISVTLRASNTDNVLTAPTEVTFYVKGITPALAPIGSVQERVGGTLRNRKGARTTYAIECWPFTVRDTTDTGAFQDQGTLTALDEAIKYHRYLWLYSVSSALRVSDSTAADYWNSGLPVAVVLSGDAIPSADYATGGMNYDFDLEAVSVALS